ncbi:MAG: substrate-binding domain-containing protein [Bacteroidetes bacterium]|nr:substrate-binding domain-containing protein [Bacteroidota bacterium]
MPYALCLLTSCGNGASTPTQGKQKIFIDESYAPLFQAEVEAFEGFYKNSDIEDVYKPEGEIINDFLNDTCRIVILGRDLTQKEKDFFVSRKSFPHSTKIAVDALAFITHKENQVSNLTYNELKDVFTGKITGWKLLDSSVKEKSSQDTSITIVFDNEKSCNVRMLKEKILNGGEFPKNCFAVKTNSEVIDYVSKNKNAIGIIGANWISDKDDTLTRTFLSKVNVLGVSSEQNPGDFFQPYRAYIHSAEYPFCRDVYIINREGRTGLGTGFAAFVAGEKGQLIILKAGMVPSTMPVRIVTITR